MDIRDEEQRCEPFQHRSVAWLMGVTEAKQLARAAAYPARRALLDLQRGVDGGKLPGSPGKAAAPRFERADLFLKAVSQTQPIGGNGEGGGAQQSLSVGACAPRQRLATGVAISAGLWIAVPARESLVVALALPPSGPDAPAPTATKKVIRKNPAKRDPHIYSAS